MNNRGLATEPWAAAAFGYGMVRFAEPCRGILPGEGDGGEG